MRVIGFLLLLFVLSGCKRCEINKCANTGSLQVHLVHYTEAEATPVIFRRFVKGSGFTQPIGDGYSQWHYYSGDTMHLQDVDLFVDSVGLIGYDMEIITPSNGRILQLSSLEKEQNTWENCSSWPYFESKIDIPCTNKIISFQYNVNAGSVLSDGNDIYVIH